MQDKKALSIERLQVIRKSLGYSKQAFADSLSYPKYAETEAGKLDLSGELVAKLLQIHSVNPLWLYGESSSRFLDLTINTVPKYIVIGEEDEELILMVNQKASAGYPQNILDKDWYKDLPSMKLPLSNYKNATYRGFQVHGDSMLPSIYPGDWVIGRSVPSLQEISSGKIYIVVLLEAVVVKQLIMQKGKSNTILLRSTNHEYDDLEVQAKDIQELWEVSSKLSFAVSVPEDNSLRKELQESMRSFLKD